MKTETRRIDIKSLVLGALVGACIMFSVAAATTPGSRTAWEYKLVQGTVEGPELMLGDELNKQSAQGWDFVSASQGQQFIFAIMRREKK